MRSRWVLNSASVSMWVALTTARSAWRLEAQTLCRASHECRVDSVAGQGYGQTDAQDEVPRQLICTTSVEEFPQVGHCVRRCSDAGPHWSVDILVDALVRSTATPEVEKFGTPGTADVVAFGPPDISRHAVNGPKQVALGLGGKA